MLLVSATPASGEPEVVLRLASVAPDGSILARELRTFASEVESETEGKVRIKWFMNAVAGDEIEQGERIKRGQLDGTAGGGMFCNRIMPTMRVTAGDSEVPASPSAESRGQNPCAHAAQS